MLPWDELRRSQVSKEHMHLPRPCLRMRIWSVSPLMAIAAFPSVDGPLKRISAKISHRMILYARVDLCLLPARSVPQGKGFSNSSIERSYAI